jgi:cellobiose-specific phosphotransferase system component IIA
VAVAAFKGVTTLDMRQAGNNSKAEVVMIHMQDMMSVLFQWVAEFCFFVHGH